jgi:hypothetical protein
MLAILLAMSAITFAVTAKPVAASSAYKSGYNHGCSDAQNDDEYIDTPGKGPAFHTRQFMSGYEDGHNACSDAADGGGSNSGGVVQSSQPPSTSGNSNGKIDLSICDTGRCTPEQKAIVEQQKQLFGSILGEAGQMQSDIANNINPCPTVDRDMGRC